MCGIWKKFVEYMVEQWEARKEASEELLEALFPERRRPISSYDIGKEGEELFIRYLEANYPKACVIQSPRSRSPIDIWKFQYEEDNDTIVIELYQVKASKDNYSPEPLPKEREELKEFTKLVLKTFRDCFRFNKSCRFYVYVVVKSYWIMINLKEKRFSKDFIHEEQEAGR